MKTTEIAARIREAGFETWNHPQCIGDFVCLKDGRFVRIGAIIELVSDPDEVRRIRRMFDKKNAREYYAALGRIARRNRKPGQATWDGWAANQDRAYPRADY